jgi:hypothetical protein
MYARAAYESIRDGSRALVSTGRLTLSIVVATFGFVVVIIIVMLKFLVFLIDFDKQLCVTVAIE